MENCCNQCITATKWEASYCDKKDEANDWFDAAMRAGKLARDSSREILSKKRNKSEIDRDNE